MFFLLVIFALALVAGTAAGLALAPRPENQPPPAVGQVKAPTAAVGREIPVLFGCRKINGPNVVWFGHVRTEPHRKSGGGK